MNIFDELDSLGLHKEADWLLNRWIKKAVYENMDPWSVMALNYPGTPQEAQAKFRDLARTHHPDAPGGNTEKFQEINHAYDLLKQHYQGNSQSWRRNQNSKPNYEYECEYGCEGDWSDEDIFEEIMFSVGKTLAYMFGGFKKSPTFSKEMHLLRGYYNNTIDFTSHEAQAKIKKIIYEYITIIKDNLNTIANLNGDILGKIPKMINPEKILEEMSKSDDPNFDQIKNYLIDFIEIMVWANQ